jgi:hypothetical protein
MANLDLAFLNDYIRGMETLFEIIVFWMIAAPVALWFDHWKENRWRGRGWRRREFEKAEKERREREEHCRKVGDYEQAFKRKHGCAPQFYDSFDESLGKLCGLPSDPYGYRTPIEP